MYLINQQYGVIGAVNGLEPKWRQVITCTYDVLIHLPISEGLIVLTSCLF